MSDPRSSNAGYTRISRPGKARRDGTEAEKRAASIWVCPGCGRRALTARGLSHHLSMYPGCPKDPIP